MKVSVQELKNLLVVERSDRFRAASLDNRCFEYTDEYGKVTSYIIPGVEYTTEIHVGAGECNTAHYHAEPIEKFLSEFGLELESTPLFGGNKKAKAVQYLSDMIAGYKRAGEADFTKMTQKAIMGRFVEYIQQTGNEEQVYLAGLVAEGLKND